MLTIVAGGRDFDDRGLLFKTLDEMPEISVVISGAARGADTLGEMWARSRHRTLYRMPAEWDRFGKSAGYRRNERMADAAEALVAFWDGKSRGTKHMIDIAKRRGLRVTVISY